MMSGLWHLIHFNREIVRTEKDAAAARVQELEETVSQSLDGVWRR